VTRETVIDSPVGRIRIVAEDAVIRQIWFVGDDVPLCATGEPLLAAAVRQLEEYFAGRRTSFDLPLAPQGSAFQQKVWAALRDIPYGATVSYGELASSLGLVNGARAVGAANGQNPIAIVVPCHRVIGANGRLVGYAGGLDRKRLLLEVEAHLGDTTGQLLAGQGGEGCGGPLRC
jgi:methylated-DNA-[protein]-cysteine S-methyltransferase